MLSMLQATIHWLYPSKLLYFSSCTLNNGYNSVNENIRGKNGGDTRSQALGVSSAFHSVHRTLLSITLVCPSAISRI